MSSKPSPDVVVIGAGVIGLSAAHALAREGLRVTVLERGACGREASWAGAGMVECGSWHRRDALVRMQRESMRRYPAWTRGLQERTGIDPEHLPCGKFELLLTDQQYRMALSEARAAGAYSEEYGRTVLEVLAPEEACRLEPHLTHEQLGVLSSPLTAQVRNPLLLDALRAACLAEGAEIVEHCEVRALVQSGERVVGVRTADRELPAGHVVLAAGAWVAQMDTRLAELIPVYPVRGQIVLLETLPPLLGRIVERGRCYIVPRRDGRIVIGATEEHDSGFDKRNTAEGVAGLIERATRLVPALAGATLIRAWSGLRPGTPDRAPYIGPVPGFDGLIAACGHFRSGLTLAPITASIIADLVQRGRTDHDISRLAPGRELKRQPRIDDVETGSRSA